MDTTTFRIAIVGSGPAGLFTADELLRRRPGCRIDVYEQAAAHGGLVRYGVAPDHPHTRRALKLLDATLAKPGIHLHLNQRLGDNISITALRESHDAVVIATGAAHDRQLGLAGSHLPRYWTSSQFAGWVNGHPACRALKPPADAKTVIVLGHGNVALDVARLLARPPADLQATDMDPGAREVLAGLGIQRIVITGRREPIDAAFGVNELEEVSRLAGWHVQADMGDLPAVIPEDPRISDVVGILARLRVPPAPVQARRIVIAFNHQPKQVEGHAHVTGLKLERTTVDAGTPGRPCRGTGESVSWPANWIIQATGHVGERLAGLPFDDERGVIPNDKGRVLEAGKPLPGVYVVGWIKRGAKGLIGHNRRDAMETVDAVLADFPR